MGRRRFSKITTQPALPTHTHTHTHTHGGGDGDSEIPRVGLCLCVAGRIGWSEELLGNYDPRSGSRPGIRPGV